MSDEDESDGELVVGGPLPLTPKELDFCERFGSPESDTYGKGTLSAKLAGYEQPHNAAWKLRRRPRIIAKLEEYQEAVRATVGKVLADLEAERLIALAKDPPDTAAAIRATELMGKHLGMFVDFGVVTTFDLERRRQFTDREIEEGSRLARLAILDGLERPPTLALPAPPQPAATIGRDVGQNGD
jgi:hypothetical protein